MSDMIANRYVVSKLIGEGGMADVYLAIDSVLKRQVAIKVLRGNLNEDPVNIKRFHREASAITHMSHPNIVEVFDVGEEHGRNYIVMEYVPGKTLKQLIKARGALSPDEAVNIMKQLVSATAHAHRNGVIHRDIKSQNVLIKDDGTVKLSDFGIASSKDAQQLTQTDTVMGSVHYLAPELTTGNPATVQSDIYSLGIVFFEMLTGDVPFHGDEAVQIAMKHLYEDVPSVRTFNPAIPQSVENIIIKSTAKKKEDRYSSAEEMYDDLITCLDISRAKEAKYVVASKVEEEAKKKEPKSIKRKKRERNIDGNTVLVGIVALLLCVTIVLILMLLTGSIGGSATKVLVPNVVGYSIDDATMILESQGFTIEAIEREATTDTEKDIVIRTDPEAGSEALTSESIIIYVSSGKYFIVENYVGVNINSIQSVLESYGFTVNVTKVQDTTHDEGTILSQSLEEGTTLSPEDTKEIDFTVAEAVMFLVPSDIIGKTVEEAQEQLEALGAVVELEQLSAEENIDAETGEYINEPGTVVQCSPEVNTLYTQTKESKITLYYY